MRKLFILFLSLLIATVLIGASLPVNDFVNFPYLTAVSKGDVPGARIDVALF